MILGLYVKQQKKNVRNAPLSYKKHSHYANDILPDNVIHEFYGKPLKYNDKGKRIKKTRKIKKHKTNKTKKLSIF